MSAGRQQQQQKQEHQFDWMIFGTAFLAGIFGIGAHMADVYTCYDDRPQLEQVVHSHHDILKIEKAFELIRAKPVSHFHIGHVLAMTLIPLGFLGTYHLYNIVLLKHRAMGKENDFFHRAIRIVLVSTLFITYTAGTIMHCTWTFMSLTLNFVANHSEEGSALAGDLMELLKPYFEITSDITINYLLKTANFATIGLIVLQQVPWKLYMLLFTPLFSIGLAEAVGAYLPLGSRLYIAVASYNLSSGLLWLAAAAYYYLNYQTMFIVDKKKTN